MRTCVATIRRNSQRADREGMRPDLDSLAGAQCWIIGAAIVSGLGCNSLEDGAARADGMPRVVPVDTRGAVLAESSPPPLSGGTLQVTRDGQLALVADEARDRVSVVDLSVNDLSRNGWRGEIAFEPGAEPGRLSEGPDGQVFVVLRGRGSVATIDPVGMRLVRETPVCAEPRGIAYDEGRNQVYVACVSGRFLSLSPAGELIGTTQLPQDLRDVVVENGNVWVSRFRSAEVLRLDEQLAIVQRLSPPALARSRVNANQALETERFEPGVAWRMQARPDGGVIVVHQSATTSEIDLTAAETPSGAYGSGSGGFGDCSGIQRSSVTTFTAAGVVRSGPDVPVNLPVDIAVNSSGEVAVAAAGQPDLFAPQATLVAGNDAPFISGGSRFFGGESNLVRVAENDPNQECAFNETPLITNVGETQPEQYLVAVAAHPQFSGTFIAQMREPAQLVIANSSQEPTVIPLGGDSVADTGFDLFHRTAESGLACASCHPDGGDDAHAWNFSGQGLRRTQPVDIGLADTAPFHWDGSLPRLDELMGEVFVKRMGGVHQSSDRLSALSDWLFELTPPVAEVPSDDAAVLRGRRLFESLEVGCASCHRGAALTDNNSYDVGTGEPGERFQVPSLIGIGTRSKLIHDGCASSLRERFELDCAGGDRHGKVSQLEAAEIDDLVSYLQTL
jgi:DNA-binding beta-propeller fold protein YncE/mono/diheme cytochrome c family protein